MYTGKFHGFDHAVCTEAAYSKRCNGRGAQTGILCTRTAVSCGPRHSNALFFFSYTSRLSSFSGLGKVL